MFDVSNIVGLFVNFCCCFVCCNDCCKCLVKLGLIFVLLFLFVCNDWCNICFNFGVSVMIGNFWLLLLIFCIMRCFREICIVEISMLGFWFFGVYFVSVCIMVCMLWIGMFLYSRVCNIFIMVDSDIRFGIRFLISLGLCLVSIFSSCCIFLNLSNW